MNDPEERIERLVRLLTRCRGHILPDALEGDIDTELESWWNSKRPQQQTPPPRLRVVHRRRGRTVVKEEK